jgi:hypothetical protein
MARRTIVITGVDRHALQRDWSRASLCWVPAYYHCLSRSEPADHCLPQADDRRARVGLHEVEDPLWEHLLGGMA